MSVSAALATRAFVLVGGGGFSHGEDPELEDFLIDSFPGSPRSAGYVGAANGDDPQRIERFYDRFRSFGLVLSHLPTSKIGAFAQNWILSLDILYLGGGNTAALIQFLIESGIAACIKAGKDGPGMVAGVSAGAACWFEFALSNSRGSGLETLSGLGIVPGSCCVHYSTEPERRRMYKSCIVSGKMPAGFAIGDGACLVLEPGSKPYAFVARQDSGVWMIDRRYQGVAIRNVPSLAK